MTSLLFSLLLLLSFSVNAQLDIFTLNNYQSEYIIFNGLIQNEQDEQYGYYFEVNIKDNILRSKAYLFDLESKKRLLENISDARILSNNFENKYVIGDAFISYDPITASYIFGFKNRAKEGFNLKVDLLSQDLNTKQLNNSFYQVTTTGLVNGHMTLGKKTKEIFLSSTKSWAFHLWQKLDKNFEVLFCSFCDLEGFYALTDEESIVEYLSAQNLKKPISQFIKVSQLDNNWHIKIPMPKNDFILEQLSLDSKLLAGFTGKEKEGFCVYII